jgi:hypothetical protein
MQHCNNQQKELSVYQVCMAFCTFNRTYGFTLQAFTPREKVRPSWRSFLWNSLLPLHVLYRLLPTCDIKCRRYKHIFIYAFK